MQPIAWSPVPVYRGSKRLQGSTGADLKSRIRPEGPWPGPNSFWGKREKNGAAEPDPIARAYEKIAAHEEDLSERLLSFLATKSGVRVIEVLETVP